MTIIRTGWQSTSLKHGFKRTVIGFDLRKVSSINNLFMTSYDDSVRYEEIYDEYQSELSGLNIFCSDPSGISMLKMPIDAIVIGFDLPLELISYLSKGNVSSPNPLPTRKLGRNWKFVGFDIVDAFTQTSAIHGFDLTQDELLEMSKNVNFAFNSHGLIEEEISALRASSFFDDLIVEHAPFSPCGIWLKAR